MKLPHFPPWVRRSVILILVAAVVPGLLLAFRVRPTVRQRAAIEVVVDNDGQHYVAGYGGYGGGIWVTKLNWRNPHPGG